jgi:hypothetical protein
MCLSITDQLLSRFITFLRYCRKNETVHKLFIDFKIAHDSVKRDMLYSILREFGSTHEISPAD